MNHLWREWGDSIDEVLADCMIMGPRKVVVGEVLSRPALSG